MAYTLLSADKLIDIHSLLFGGEHAWFLIEVLLRGVIMFVMVLASLRILGKRGVKQLSIFELVIIITLGSAGGDAIFYKEVGLVVALTVFLVIVLLYRLVIYLTMKSRRFNILIEGEPVLIIQNGKFAIENFENEPISNDEFFAELRMEGVSQLGQVYKVYNESNSELSIFYYPDEEVKYGLPIFPELLEKKKTEIEIAGMYSCYYCGNTLELQPGKECHCPGCNKTEWLPSSNAKRIT